MDGLKKSEIQHDALQLSPQDRLDVVQALWESLESDEVPVYPWQQQVINERIAEAEKNPDARQSFQTVRQEMENNLRN